MKLSCSFLLLAIASCMMAADVQAKGNGRHTETHVKCTTLHGGKHYIKNLPRQTRTATVTAGGCTVTKRPIKLVTVTPTAKTNTVTSTATVTSTDQALQSTDTFTTISTSTVVEPLTVSETATVTSTQTSTVTVTPTSTVPAGPYFTPIGGAPVRRDQIPVERDAGTIPGLLQVRGGSAGGCRDPRNYAKSVKCVKRVVISQDKTVTAGRTKTITKYAPTPAPSTAVVTTTSTSTVAPPDVTNTVSSTVVTTSTATTTQTSTETATTTSTETASAPTVTVNAVCSSGSNNFLQVSNVYNNGGNQCNGGSIFGTTTATSAEDCCTQCQASETCQGSAFGGGGRCVLLNTPSGSASCPASLGAAYQAGVARAGSGYQLSNGACSTFQIAC